MAKANYVTVASDKSKATLKFLTLFPITGLLGIQYWYVRRYRRALLSMFTMNLFAFGWFCDIITVLSGNFRDGDGQKVRR